MQAAVKQKLYFSLATMSGGIVRNRAQKLDICLLSDPSQFEVRTLVGGKPRLLSLLSPMC